MRRIYEKSLKWDMISTQREDKIWFNRWWKDEKPLSQIRIQEYFLNFFKMIIDNHFKWLGILITQNLLHRQLISDPPQLLLSLEMNTFRQSRRSNFKNSQWRICWFSQIFWKTKTWRNKRESKKSRDSCKYKWSKSAEIDWSRNKISKSNRTKSSKKFSKKLWVLSKKL